MVRSERGHCQHCARDAVQEPSYTLLALRCSDTAQSEQHWGHFCGRLWKEPWGSLGSTRGSRGRKPKDNPLVAMSMSVPMLPKALPKTRARQQEGINRVLAEIDLSRKVLASLDCCPGPSRVPESINQSISTVESIHQVESEPVPVIG